MSPGDIVISVIAVLFCLLWIAYFIKAIVNLFAIPILERLQLPQLSNESNAGHPKISLIIAACNEGQVIQHALKTLAAQDYPDLEMIIVNDRSTDDTGDIIDAFARTDARVKAVHIDQLPEKWLGKVHALHQGAKIASGDWLIFTDADIHFKQGVLQQAMAYVLKEQTDHLVLFPKVLASSFLLNVAISAFESMLLATINLGGLKKPGMRSFVGVGAFNMVKKSIIDKAGGLEWLRMEVIDDMGLGLMVKKTGGCSSIAYAGEHVKVDWYPGLIAMFKGLEKNAFGPGIAYNYTVLILMVVMIWLLCLAPVMALAWSDLIYIQSLGVFSWLVFFVFLIVSKLKFDMSILPGLFFQPGLFFISCMMINSAIKCKMQGGINWRGTIYPVAELKKGQRISVFLKDSN